MLKALIFDLNGVLINDTFDIVKVFQEAAKEGGLKVPTKKAILSTLGLTWPEMRKKIFGGEEKYKEILNKTWMKHEKDMKLMAGMEKILASLNRKKAIVTSSAEPYLQRMLKGYVDYFDAIITAESTEKHKPDPEPLLLACRKLEIKPNEAVYIGDRLIDFKTAKNAGMDFIGFLSGGTTEEEFKKAGAKKTIKSLSELLKLLNNFEPYTKQ